MSNQLLLAKSGSLSLLITVILADVNKHMGKTLLFTGKSFKSLERTLTSIPHLTAWSTWDKYGIIASLQNLMWDKWSLLGMIKQEWFSESGNENFTVELGSHRKLMTSYVESEWPQKPMTCHYEIPGISFLYCKCLQAFLYRNKLSNQWAFKWDAWCNPDARHHLDMTALKKFSLNSAREINWLSPKLSFSSQFSVTL